MFCDHCHVDLHGAAESQCPACGSPFDPADSDTYRATPFMPSPRERRRIKCDVAVVLLSVLVAFILAVTIFQITGLFD